MSTYIAVDLGASSGRVFAAQLIDGMLVINQVHRFSNEPVSQPDGLHWNIRGLYDEIVVGLALAARRYTDIVSIGIDSWAVDYGLFNEHGELIEDPFHYRDSRTDGVAQRTYQSVSARDQYVANGLQYLPFNTMFQLEAARQSEALARANTILMIPDLIAYWLTGVVSTEETNVSTTGLRDVRTGRWSADVMAAIALDPALLAPLVRPGTVLGSVTSDVAARTGLDGGVVVTTVGSHDTASAVVGVPAHDHRFAYISCGTWGLVGVELNTPVLTDESRLANFTNEGGVDDTIRFLRNVTGLWLVQECVRVWSLADPALSLSELITAAGQRPNGGPTFDVDDAALLPPGDIPARISELLSRWGAPSPLDHVSMLRCIIDSLADAFAHSVTEAARLSSHPIDVVHMVGGGSQNELLCQLTANRCGLPVVAGPVEATVVGNALVQLRAHGEIAGDLAQLRSVVRKSFAVQAYLPV